MDSQKLNICICPLKINWNQKKDNFIKLTEALSEMHPDTDLFILPETFSTGFPVGKSLEEVTDLGENENGETISLLKSLSLKFNIAIAGTFIAKSEDSLFNRAFFVEPSGDVYYSDKAHLFRIGGEDKIFTSGNKRMNIRFRGWSISLVVCYDIRFPVWCRNKNNEYEVLVVVANWPEVRDNVWKTLLCARAIENLSYVCGANCEGFDAANQLRYSGGSFVFDFKGKEISTRIQGSNLVYASLNKKKIEEFREKFPAWKDSDNFKLI
ncbi:MAG: nitrilase family protein [Muribaculaceae bacterium]|nr:nitrilase family protein [Muribaculaceae bacterium]